jgi:hypothetical protein
MPLTPQSIRSNVLIKLNDVHVRKEEIIALSQDWNEKQISYFKKILQQGGIVKINGNRFEIEIQETIVNSRGDKDGGIITVPGEDERF